MENSIEEEKEELINYLSKFKTMLFYSKYIDPDGYDNITEVLDILANTVGNNLREVKAIEK